MLNLSGVPEHGAREHPDRTAPVSGAARPSHSRLNALACQVAALPYPRPFEFRDGPPPGPAGKILKRELR